MAHKVGPVEKLVTYVFEGEAPLPTPISRTDLVDGLYLAPIEPYLLAHDNDYNILQVSPRFSQFFRDHLHECTLNVRYVGQANLNHEGVDSDEHIVKQRVTAYLLAAMLHSPRFLAPHASIVSVPSEGQICHSEQMLDFGHLEADTEVPLDADDFDQIGRLYGSMSDLVGGGKTGRVATALAYYQQAFRPDISWPVRFLSMVMALEALFSRGTLQVSHEVCERLAFFLGETPTHRQQLYDEMRSHYDRRSAIAHGREAQGNRSELEEAFVDVLNKLRECLLKIISDQVTRDLFRTAKSDQFVAAMKHLIFHGGLPPPATGS
jgi:hypothetical protein